MYERTVQTESIEQTTALFGELDANMALIEEAFSVTVTASDAGGSDTDKPEGSLLVIRSQSEDRQTVDDAAEALEILKRMASSNGTLSEQNIRYVISMTADGKADELSDFDGDCICITSRGKPIKAKTIGQKKYVEAIKKNTVILGLGPAGTGKTFLAVAMAVTALRSKQVNRILLTRPAVEAGERLGYLPGDLQSKIDPYLRPLYDALYEMLGTESYSRLVEKGVIEIAPLAYMRGRTLDDSFIILDEAQNTTPEQMKMFLTRLGFNSKVVVTGDLTQTDLPAGKRSGLAEAAKILKNIDEIAIHTFTERDVVRHHLVQKIIQAYEKNAREKKENESKTGDVRRFYRR